MKIVINACHGGFGLSHEAMMLYSELADLNLDFSESNYGSVHYYVDGMIDDEKFYFSDRDIARDDLDLIAVVERLGEKANGKYSELKVIEIPDDVNWYVEEYDGREWVAERHRTWS